MFTYVNRDSSEGWMQPRNNDICYILVFDPNLVQGAPLGPRNPAKDPPIPLEAVSRASLSSPCSKSK